MDVTGNMDAIQQENRQDIYSNALQVVSEQREVRQNGEPTQVVRSRPISRMDQFFADRQEKERKEFAATASYHLPQVNDQQPNVRENNQSSVVTQSQPFISKMDLYFIRKREREEKERNEQTAQSDQSIHMDNQQSSNSMTREVEQAVSGPQPRVTFWSAGTIRSHSDHSGAVGPTVAVPVQFTTEIEQTVPAPIKSILKVNNNSSALVSNDHLEDTATSVQSAANNEMPESGDWEFAWLEEELCQTHVDDDKITQEQFETWYYPPVVFPPQDPQKLDLIYLFSSYEIENWPDSMKVEETENDINIASDLMQFM